MTMAKNTYTFLSAYSLRAPALEFYKSDVLLNRQKWESGDAQCYLTTLVSGVRKDTGNDQNNEKILMYQASQDHSNNY